MLQLIAKRLNFKGSADEIADKRQYYINNNDINKLISKTNLETNQSDTFLTSFMFKV